MGKTETIKERAIYVYLPSIKMTERWKELADNAGTSISKFVMEHVENSLRQEESEVFRPRTDLLKELDDLKERLDEANKRISRQDILIDRLQEDLRRYRAKPFVDEDYMGIREYSRKLVEILREESLISNENLISRLGVDYSETDVLKGVSNQLEMLESYGLIRSTPNGWRWVDDS